MAAIGFGREDVSEYLIDGVTIACENSPQSTTISGDSDKIDSVIANIKSRHPDLLARKLRVEMAYHSGKLILLYFRCVLFLLCGGILLAFWVLIGRQHT